MPWDNNNIYDPMSAVPGAVPAPRPAGQNPAATNYAPGRYAGVADAIRAPGQFVGNVTGWQDRAGGQRGEVRDARWYQNQVIQALQQQAAGDMNSQAQQQLRDSFQRARAQQASLGSTVRGQSAGAAMRSIQAGQQGISRGQAGEEQMLKLQEQQAAQAMLAQLLAQQRNQDIEGAKLAGDYQLGQNELADKGILSIIGNDITGAANLGAYNRGNSILTTAGEQQSTERTQGWIKKLFDMAGGAGGTFGSFGGKGGGGGGGGGNSSAVPSGDLY